MSEPLKNGKVRANIYLPQELVARLDEDAKIMGTSRGGIITQRLMQFYLDMDTQIQLNNGIKAMTGMSSDDLMKKILSNMLDNMEK